MPFWVAQPIFYMIFKIFLYNICTFCQFHYSKGFRFSSVSPKRLRGGDSGNHRPIGQKALIQNGAVERVMTLNVGHCTILLQHVWMFLWVYMHDATHVAVNVV